MAADRAGQDPEKAEEQAGNSPGTIKGPYIISYNLREEERPDEIKVRWKWRVETVETGRKAQALDARQAEVIRRILQWQYDRKHTQAQ